MYNYTIGLNEIFDSFIELKQTPKFVYSDKSNEKLTLEILVPGANKEDVDIEIKNNWLNIDYKNDKYKTYISYTTEVSEYNIDTISTELKNGVLTIILDKKEELKARKITLT